MSTLQEPEGIAFFSIKTGETFYAKLEPTIAALINSSDMGINASRGQDFGWRLAPIWVKKVRAFRADEEKMDTLAAKLRLEDGVAPNTTQILYYIYGRQVRQYLQRLQDEDNPFEEQYQSEISGGGSNSPKEMPTHLKVAMDDEEVTEDVTEEEVDDGDKSTAADSAESATESGDTKSVSSSGNKQAGKATPGKK